MRNLISLTGLLFLACAPEGFEDDVAAGGKADEGEEMAEDACLWDGRYRDNRCDDTCAQPDPACWNWDAPVSAEWGVAIPIQVRVHYPMEFRFHHQSESRVSYKSRDFESGLPGPWTATERGFHCYVFRSSEGWVQGTAAYGVWGPNHRTTVFGTHTSATSNFFIDDNPEGLKSVACRYSVEGQDPDLTITWRMVRDAFWNANSGAYLAIEHLEPQYPTE